MRRRFYFHKGRVAFYALLKAAGLGKNDALIVPGYTCVVVPMAIRFAGCVPFYADIAGDTFSPSLEEYERTAERIKRDFAGVRLRGVVIQHTYGIPNPDSFAIVGWAKSKGLLVFEDCAHVSGSTLDGQVCGSLGHGAFFSTQWNKPYTTGLGGFADVNDEELAERVGALHGGLPAPSMVSALALWVQWWVHRRLVRPRGYWAAVRTYRSLTACGIVSGSSSPTELNGHMPPRYFMRMASLQRGACERLEKRAPGSQRRRIRLADHYDRLLPASGITPQCRPQGTVILRYPILVGDRERLLKEAADGHIELGDWFNHPLHPAGACLDNLNWDDRECPNAVSVARNVVNLPLHEHVSEEYAEKCMRFVVGAALRHQERQRDYETTDHGTTGHKLKS